MKSAVKAALSSIGYELRRKSDDQTGEIKGLLLLDLLRSEDKLQEEARKLVRFIIDHIHLSRSQIFQDLFVLHALNGKRNGYFVEFGATDGEFLSNSYALEKYYGWTGILAEPCKSWHQALKANRTCTIDFRCVWKVTGDHLQFAESDLAEVSTLSKFKNASAYSKNYSVETVSLNDLLSLHSAPRAIDYLSIDTEGSELEILQAFDFSKHSFQVITLEHNYDRLNRGKLHHLLTSNGYVRKFENLSLFDDWYVFA
jgi:FkbM family methyltransferase